MKGAATRGSLLLRISNYSTEECLRYTEKQKMNKAETLTLLSAPTGPGVVIAWQRLLDRKSKPKAWQYGLNGSERKEKVRKKHEGERDSRSHSNPPGIQPQELTRGCVSNSVIILLKGNAIRVSPQSISSGGSKKLSALPVYYVAGSSSGSKIVGIMVIVFRKRLLSLQSIGPFCF